MPIPNLVILGAQKSGTTSVRNALLQHPDIFMSGPVKEPTYFFPEDELAARLERYGYSGVGSRDAVLENWMLKNYAGQKIFGEASTDYTFSDRARTLGIPARMLELQPEIRFIYIMRNPFARMLSVQRHQLDRRGRDIFANIISGKEQPLKDITLTSCYVHQISAYFEYFDRDRFLFLEFDEFTKNQTGSLKRIFDFLGLPPLDTFKHVHSNAASAESSNTVSRIPRAVLEKNHERVLADMQNLQAATGLDPSIWDLRFETWCDDQA